MELSFMISGPISRGMSGRGVYCNGKWFAEIVKSRGRWRITNPLKYTNEESYRTQKELMGDLEKLYFAEIL